MADLISREAALEKAGWVNLYGGNKSAHVVFSRDIHQLPAVDAVEAGSCEGCIYSHRKRPQKCSCCRRNRDLKDCYERREENAAD